MAGRLLCCIIGPFRPKFRFLIFTLPPVGAGRQALSRAPRPFRGGVYYQITYPCGKSMTSTLTTHIRNLYNPSSQPIYSKGPIHMSNFDPGSVSWSVGILSGWTYDKPMNKWFQGQFRAAHRITRPCPTCSDTIVLDVTTKALRGEATNHGLSLRRCKACRQALNRPEGRKQSDDHCTAARGRPFRMAGRKAWCWKLMIDRSIHT